LGIVGFITLYTGKSSEIALDPIVYADEYTRALLISTAGLVVFHTGYYAHGRSFLPLPLILRVEWEKKRVVFIVILYFAVAAISFLTLLHINGGVVSFLEGREAWRAGGLKGQGFLIFPATGLAVIAVLVNLLSKVINNGERKKRFWVTSFILLILSSIAPITMGFRSAIALPIIQFMLIWHLAYRKIKTKNLILASLFIITGFTLYGIIREIPTGVDLNSAALKRIVIENPELAYGIVSRSKGTEVVASVIHKLDETKEYEFGWRGLVEALTIIIPKSIWENKPAPVGERFTTYFFGDALRLLRGSEQEVWGGISPTAVGELYWHFGWIGVLIGLYVLGKIIRITYNTVLHHARNKGVLLIYAILYTSFAMFAETFQGYVNGIMINSVFIIFTILILVVKVANDGEKSAQ